MAAEVATSLPKGGFSFDNCIRNAYFASKNYPAPKTFSTGTTIVGIVYKDGAIIGADTRATADTIIADKYCQKIYYLAPNMYCCGAGTAGDMVKTVDMVSSQLELHKLDTDRVVPVCMANNIFKQHLFRYQGHVSAAFIIGGVDDSGPSVYSIQPHGSTKKSPFATMGSGSLAAMSVLETGWKPDMTLEEGRKLVRDAIASGVFNDMGSGTNVDICVITKDGVQLSIPYEKLVPPKTLSATYKYALGTTAVISTNVIPLEVVETVVRPIEDMDVSG